MPRKQRFKPSRKPKAAGTQTDLAVVAETAPTIPAAPKDVSLGTEVPSRRDSDAYSTPTEIGGESG